MAVTRVDYSEQAVAAAHSVLLELVHLLGEYRDSIVLIGGMVPRLLIPQAEEAHIGTLDVDLALDHRRFEEAGYRTVHELLTSRGYGFQGSMEAPDGAVAHNGCKMSGHAKRAVLI